MAILVCNCDHVFQDKRYGKKRRLMNPLGPGKVGEFRCTVCGKTRRGNVRPVNNNKEK